MTTKQSVLEKLKRLFAASEIVTPCYFDDCVCREGDGNGRGFVYDSSFNDGPPILETYEGVPQAELIAYLLTITPSLIAALEWVEKKAKSEPEAKPNDGYWLGFERGEIEFARDLLEKFDPKLLTRLEGKGE